MNTIFYDSFSLEYKEPFGAVKQYHRCRFTLKFPRDRNIDQPTLAMFRPGFKEKFVQLDHKGIEGNLNIYSCEYIPDDLGLHHYYFFVMQNGARCYVKRRGASFGSFDGNELFQLTVYDSKMTTPDWIKGGIMYQIFPDRFAIKQTHKNIPIPDGRTIHHDWYETPDWWPNEKGIITNTDFFGGNIPGITSKLSYLEELGVTCIYLCPIFESHENHRYNTANYEKIDPMLGDEEDFELLCEKAKKHNINIILDGVFSHTGADSIYFNKFGRYGEKEGAFRDPKSPYRQWYSFQHYPNTYDSWWGFDTLPNVIENNPSYTEYICGKDGILQKWIDKGAKGWRLDVVDELPDEFIDNLRIAVKDKGQDNIIYGEVWEDASNKESYGVRRRYLTGDQLDSVMNYPFKELILNYIKYSDYISFRDGVMTILEHYPKPCSDTLMNMLSTHDVERAITRLAGEPVGDRNREWQANHQLSDSEYIYGKSLLKCAMVLQFFLPGVPCIYYGDEAGMEGYKDPFNRRTYPWGYEDSELLEFVDGLSKVRKGSEVFKEGGLEFWSVEPTHCIFSRKTDNEAVIIYLNKSKKAMRFSLTFPEEVIKFSILRSNSNHRDVGQIKVSPYDYAAIKVTIASSKNHPTKAKSNNNFVAQIRSEYE